MELLGIFGANILFLALVCIGVHLERRVYKLERERESLEVAAERIAALSERIHLLEDAAPAPKSERDAQERFSKGVENILSYAMKLPQGHSIGGNINENF